MHRHRKHKRSSGHHKDRNANQKPPEKIEDVTKNENVVSEDTGDFHFKGLPNSLQIRHSEILGRYLVATRDIRAGESLIRDEEALVMGPCQGGIPALCLGCCQPLELPLSLGHHCKDCGLPMCSTTCPQVNKHLPECELLRAGGAVPLAPQLFDENSALYNAIVPLRCLYLRDKDPETWNTIMAMESHNEIRRVRDIIWKTNQDLVVNPIRADWGLGEMFSELEIHTVCGVLEVNGFEVGLKGRSVRALFPLSFLMAHDCTPNTCHTDDSNGRMFVRAAYDIQKGQSVTLSYAYTLQGTMKRRQHLREGKFFDCACARCSDPTELGTYCSALVCPRCKAPRVISSDPLNEAAAWSCVVCKDYNVPSASVEHLLNRLGEEAETIDPNDIEAFEEYINKYSCILPPSHYLVLGAKHSLSILYGKIPGYLINDLSDELLRRKRDICKEILPVFDILEPGMSRLRGIILYELHAPLMILATRAFDSRSVHKQELQANIKEVAQCLEKSSTILKFEPKGSPEHSMADAAIEALKQVNEWRRLIGNYK